MVPHARSLPPKVALAEHVRSASVPRRGGCRELCAATASRDKLLSARRPSIHEFRVHGCLMSQLTVECVEVLGVNVSVINVRDAIAAVEAWIASRPNHYVS